MKDKIAAVACNLRNLLWRVEELRGEIYKEGEKIRWDNIYDLQKSVNNLASVLIVADDNLKEIEELFKAKRKIKRSRSKKKEKIVERV